MENASSNDLFHRQPDGTILLVRQWGTGKRGVLILLGLGESLVEGFADRLANAILAKDLTVYAVEPRGHTLSHGRWTLNAFRVDTAYWISWFARKHKELYVIASGLAASVLLEYEEQAHRMHEPPLPDGMLLLDPVFRGRDLIRGDLPRLGKLIPGGTTRALERMLRSNDALGYRHCRLDREGLRAFWDEITGYALPPVRVQTPSVLLVPTDVHADPLKRVFGNVLIRRVPWRGETGPELVRHVVEIREALKTVRESEKPIRFRAG